MKLSYAALLVALVSPCVALTAQEKVPVYKPGHEVSLPELIPTDLSSVITHDCDQKSTGTAEITFLVDSTGKVYDVAFTKFIDTELDRLALVVARANRFKPAMRNGSPVSVGLTGKIKIQGCIAQIADAAGKNSNQLRFFSQPEQTFAPWSGAPDTAIFGSAGTAPNKKNGGGVTMPRVVYQPEASFSAEARKNKIQGECMVRVIVNAAGLPESPQLISGVGHGLDEQALLAVMRYRFKPATNQDGKPVPVMLTIVVNFRFQ